MSNPKKAHCFFEQSGTFKNKFIEFGVPAEDYDVRNDFNQTDHVMDLYAEIRGGYEDKSSIFDSIGKDELIIAFFPCIRFEAQILLSFRGQMHGMEKWTIEQKLNNCMRLQDELTENYMLVNKLFVICYKKGIPLIVENPYSEEHYLRRYWCIQPKIIDKDRRDRGDYFKKPTQYWFLNCEPKNNFIFEAENYNALGTMDSIRQLSRKDADVMGASTIKVGRSMIHPDYAERFIKEFIIDYETKF